VALPTGWQHRLAPVAFRRRGESRTSHAEAPATTVRRGRRGEKLLGGSGGRSLL